MDIIEEQIQKLENYLSMASCLPESKSKRLLIDYEMVSIQSGVDMEFIKKRKFKSMIDDASAVLPIIPVQNMDMQSLSVSKFYDICIQIFESESQASKTIFTVLKKLIHYYNLNDKSDISVIFNKTDREYEKDINDILNSHTEKTKVKYVSFAIKLRQYYSGAVFSLESLPDDFLEAIRLIHEKSGLSVSQVEHKAGIKRNSARNMITGKNTPSCRQIKNIIKLERAYNIPEYSLVSKLNVNNFWRKVDTNLIPEEFRGKTNFWRKLLSNLKINFNTASSEERYEICEWIYNNIVVSNTEYSKRLRVKLKQQYRFNDFESALILKNQLKDLVAHKEATMPDFYLKKFGIWSKATSKKNTDIILYYLGYLKNINESTSGIIPGEYSLLFIMSSKLVYSYIKWQIDRRGMFSFGDYCILDLIISLCNEDTGYMYQKNYIRDAPKVAIDLLEINQDDLININKQSFWEEICVNQKKFCIKFRGELDRLYKKNQVNSDGRLILSRDTFAPISALLDKDEPWTEYYNLLKICRKNYSLATTQPKLSFSFLCSYLSAVFLLQTGLRSKNIRLLKLAEAPDNVNTTIYKLDNKYYIDAPWSQVKNKRKVLREILDVDYLYEDIEKYLFLKKKLFKSIYKNDNFFVTLQNNPYSEVSFRRNFIDFTRVYIAYNKYKDQYMIKDLHPHHPHTIRHIIATHVLKRTGSISKAALAIHDSEQTVRKHYSRFLPSDECQTFKELSQTVFF